MRKPTSERRRGRFSQYEGTFKMAVTAEDRALLEALCERKGGVSQAALLRGLLREKARELGLTEHD